MTDAGRQRSAEVIEAARQAGIQPDDPLAILLGKITVRAEAVSAARGERQDDAERTLFRAGLMIARQLTIRHLCQVLAPAAADLPTRRLGRPALPSL